MSYSVWSVIAGETPTATKWNLLGSNDADFNTRVLQLNADKTMDSQADASTITFNLSTRKIWTVTLGGNRVLALSNVDLNVPFVVRLKQDATGSRTVTWWSGIKWPANTAPTLSTTANAIDVFQFIPTATGEYDGIFVAFGLKGS